MTNVICRDCGRPGSEDPDDPAPNLCSACYEQRLARITPEFMRIADKYHDPILSAMWLRNALIKTGGERPEYADQHVKYLLRQLFGGDKQG